MKPTDYTRLKKYCEKLTAGTIEPHEYEQLGKWLLECAAMSTHSSTMQGILGYARMGECRQDGVLEALKKLKTGAYEPWKNPVHCYNWCKKVTKQAAVREAFASRKSNPKAYRRNRTLTFTECGNAPALMALCYGDDSDFCPYAEGDNELVVD